MRAYTGEHPSELYEKPLTPWFGVTILSAWSGSFCMGVTLGYTSPAADSLSVATGEDADDLRSAAYSAWFGFLLPVGALLGSVASAYVCQRMGRRFALLLSALIFMLGYATLFAASWSVVVMSGRFLTGLATGMVSLCVPTYIAEVTLPAYRGTVGGVLQLSITVGILYSYVLGRFLDWKLLAMACFVGAVLLFASSQFTIESPRWLLLTGRKLEALQALLKLRGTNFRVEDECAAIEQVFARVPTPPFHVLMAFHVHLLQQFSGINMVIFYARAIFANSGVSVTAANSSVVIAALQVAATLAAVSLMDIVGRRRLLTISSMICVFSMVSIGALHQAAGTGESSFGVVNSERLPIVFLGLYIIGYSIGLGPVVWILSAELVPCRNRGFYMGAATAFNWICVLVVTWLFNVLRETYHYSGMGWFFSSVTFVGAMLVNFFLPETQGHSLEQILLRQFLEREDTSMQSTKL